MKKWIIVLFVLSLFATLTCLANAEEAKKAGPGIASGQVVDEAGSPLPGGVVSFFNAEKEVAPLIAGMHRIPDMVGRMGPEGRFSLKLRPGSYYMGALIITGRRGPGPPRAGEKFYYARDDQGDLREIAIGTGEEKDFGQIVMALPDTFPEAKNLVTVQGRLLRDKEGIPFEGGVVLVKTNMNKQRPDFVSPLTDEAGRYEIKLPADTPYFLLGRERSAVGRPPPGTYVGTYGSETPISLGGVLPVGTMRPAQPAIGIPPQVEGMNLGPGKDLPKTVMGKPGQTLTGVDIKMFRTPVPEEIREKLQGTLGFGSKMQGTSEEQKQAAPEPEKGE